MSTTVVESFEVDDLGGLDAAGVLDALSETEHQERRASARELVILRDQHCVFPGCTRDARPCDLDHTTPSQPDDPPHSLAGETHPDNLACLCRRHHRAKTHGPWRYTRTPDGRYVWTGPQAFSKSQ
jgi:hypothetical protein